MRRSTFALTVSAMALFAASQSVAQDATPLRVGQEVRGALTQEDRRVDSEDLGQFVYDTYSVRTRGGQRLEAVMRAEGFDTYLEVFENADATEPFSADDDGLRDGTNSRLRFSTGEGTYIIRARTLSGLEGGEYTLFLSDRGPARAAPRPAPIRLGASVEGEIGSGDPEEDAEEDNTYAYDAYRLRADEGDRIALTLESDAFDPIVRIGRMKDATFEELASNDDSGAGGLNSYLVFTVPADGEYVVRAAPLGGSDEGAYTLRIAEGPPPLVTRSVAIGDVVEGNLEDSDGANAAGQRADAYTFTPRSGQRLVVTLSSDDFDTYLELFSGEGGERYTVDSDDDGAGEGTNSRLSYTFLETGEHTLEVRGFTSDAKGDYTLTLEEAEPEPAPATLAYGETAQGEIVETDPRDDENRGFDAYRFSGEAGNRVQVIMRSGDFDTYVQIGGAEGEFSAIASDDDGLGEGTDSRLNFILPSDGTFIVRASPLYADADGLYSLELIDRGPQPTAGSILSGATARGTLGEDDAIAEDGSFYDAYRIRVKQGDKLRLTMVSNDFDSFIDIGREDDEGQFTSVVSDDDSLSDTHAKIDWAVEDDGEYVIRARSFAQGQSGAYALTVEPKD